MIIGIPRPIGITYAANGATRSKHDHLGLPISGEELIEVAQEARAAGAALFSFTIRDEKGDFSFEPDLWSQNVNALRTALDGSVLLQLEFEINESGDIAHLETILRKARPDACLLRFEQILPRDGDDKDENRAQDLLDLCSELGIGVQFALRDPADVDWFYAFRQYGIIPESCRALLFVLGEDGDMPSSNPHCLRAFLSGLEKQNLLDKISWSVAAFGPQETAALTAATALGGHIAPGFAYNIHNVEGELLTSSATQLCLLGDMAGRLGRPTASAFEARTLLFGAC